MATEIRKVFQQNIVNSSIMLGEAFCGKIEICVNGCDQVSQEDRTEFLKKLEMCFREAYMWVEGQLGVTGEPGQALKDAIEKMWGEGRR